MSKNFFQRMKEIKDEKEAAKKKAQEEENRQKEKEKADMTAQIGDALLRMRTSKESMHNKLLVELQLTRMDLAKRPNDVMLKNRHYNKIKMYYSFYKYSCMMQEQLEQKNDEVMMNQGMAEFAETMKVAGMLAAQPLENMPNIDKLIRSIQENMQDSGKQFEAIDKLLAGATEARNKSLAIANCSDELIDSLLNGTILPEDELSEADVSIPQADDMEEVINRLQSIEMNS